MRPAAPSRAAPHLSGSHLRRRPAAVLAALAGLTFAASLHAQDLPSGVPSTASTPCRTLSHDAGSTGAGPPSLGLGLVLDEHLLVNGPRDEDYNGGGEIIITGGTRHAVARGLDHALDELTGDLCLSNHSASPTTPIERAMAVGMVIFTPKDLASRHAIRDDRPYASLFFVSVTRREVSPADDVAYDELLSVGILGLKAADTVQSALHRLTGSVAPQGWSHQISAGGEPTARYELTRQALFTDAGDEGRRAELKWSAAASIGTVTEGSIALNSRAGRLQSPWWAFTPDETMYVPDPHSPPAPVPVEAAPELFVFAGGRVKLRVYNAFLQGQFRHSDVRYGLEDVNSLLGELWAGVVYRPGCRWNTQVAARWESPELKAGLGSRSFLWGSIDVSRSLL